MFAVCGSCIYVKKISDLKEFDKRRDFLQNMVISMIHRNNYGDIIAKMNKFMGKLCDLEISQAKYTKITELAKKVIDATNEAKGETDWFTRDYQVKPKAYTAIMQILPLLIPDSGNKIYEL